MNKYLNNNSGNNSDSNQGKRDNNGKRSNKSINFNKIINDCTKEIEMKNNKQYEVDFKNEKDYIDSVKSEMKDFLKHFDKVKDTIEVIVYNKNQTDGLFCGAIAYHYLKEKNKSVIHIRVGPGWINIERIKNIIDSKIVLFMDLAFQNEEYIKLENICKKVISIDDHTIVKYKSDLVFISKGTHAACAYVWNSFYPTKKPPLMVQYIDVGDNKKRAKYLPFSNLIGTAISYRYTSSPYISKAKWDSGEALNDVWKLIENDKHQMYIVIGKYMNEVQENLKEQIAQNAQIRNFQGYRVGVLNFSDPALTKRISRQIITNMKNRGEKIDFVVLWAYEYTSNGYKIQLIDDHVQTKINLPEIAKKLGKIGGHPRAGSGHGHAANFYWPHDKTHDIWDLFEKKYI